MLSEINMRQVILKLVIIALLATALTGCGATPVASPSPARTTPVASEPPSTFVPAGIKIGDVAPDVTLPDASGKSVSLSQFKGRPIFINVWSST
jgi:predicted small lipoprotein YifL